MPATNAKTQIQKTQNAMEELIIELAILQIKTRRWWTRRMGRLGLK